MISRCATVKYLREVMPYFKRSANILGDILWDDDPYATPRSTLRHGERARTDMKIIPLKLAYVIRGSLYHCDREQRFIELISPNGRHSS